MENPNWNKWMLMPELELWQAAALSLDTEPDCIPMYERWQYMQIRQDFEDMPKNYIDRLEIIHANIGHKLTVSRINTTQPWKSKVLLEDFVSWCGKNNFSIPEKFNNIVPAENAEPLAFDKSSETYPTELDIAFQAWRAVSATEGKGKPKARIRKWLDTNAIHLSNEAKERIVTVANWDKSGGATRTSKASNGGG
ncbi:MAG: hypothetical protein ITD31_03515 [Nitrosospira sp.]|nr:hypothetical protein [Nitrosospira sp.]